MKKGITGIKDQDREILFKIKDEDLLKVCRLNKYLYYEVCDDMFFRNRLAKTYTDTLKYKSDDLNWKAYFLTVIYYIAKMKKNYNYKYTQGNPKISYEIFRYSEYDYDLLLHASEKGELCLVKEALKRGVNINAKNDGLRNATIKGYFEIVNYLVENGASIHVRDEEALITASYNGNLEVVKYLVENGSNIHHNAFRRAIIKAHLEIVKYLESLHKIYQ